MTYFSSFKVNILTPYVIKNITFIHLILLFNLYLYFQVPKKYLYLYKTMFKYNKY